MVKSGAATVSEMTCTLMALMAFTCGRVCGLLEYLEQDSENQFGFYGFGKS